MKRLGCLLSAAALLVIAATFAGNATGRFDQKLSADKQVVHVLNRLTFGPRPGDTGQVQRLGVKKWMDLQLHPDRIQENPVLKGKLKPLETLNLAMWQIQEKSSPWNWPASSSRPRTRSPDTTGFVHSGQSEDDPRYRPATDTGGPARGLGTGSGSSAPGRAGGAAEGVSAADAATDGSALARTNASGATRNS